MKRNAIENLISWKTSARRQPLIINGARQVGKTYLVREFAKEYFKNFCEINFEKDKDVKQIFTRDLDPKRIISELEIRYKKNLRNKDTLIFFDEIQECKDAITSLKYFAENMSDIYLIVAGSLLGVSLIRSNTSFPVGKVDTINLRPMSFDEYLIATSNEKLVDTIKDCFYNDSKMENSIHNYALIEYRKYLALGGMPRVIDTYIKESSYLLADQVIDNLQNDYLKDMEKYTSSNESLKIKDCYNIIPKQLAKENKNFKYSEIQKNKDKKYYGNSISWLENSNIVLKSRLVDTARVPLSFHINDYIFRLYMSDQGMLRKKIGTPIEKILDINYTNDMIGIIAENYVAIHLVNNNHDLYYWQGKNEYEIEFLIDDGEKIIPIEVKNSKRTTSKSLNKFLDEYKLPYAIRVSMKNFGRNERIKSIPLYAAFLL